MSKPTASAARSVRSRSLSNSQARSPSPHQGRSRAARSAACGRCAAAEQLGEIAQAAMLERLLEVGVDRVRDPRDLVDVGAAREQRQPVDQELAVGRMSGELQRVEARRRARAAARRSGRRSRG